MPFYHHYVTIEINYRRNPDASGDSESSEGPYTEVAQTGNIFYLFKETREGVVSGSSHR